MKFDPENPQHISKLCDSIDWSEEKMESRREQRLGQLRQYVGSHYGDNGATVEVPINLIELGVNIFQRGITSHFPQAMVGSSYEDYLPSAADMELALNQEIERINLADGFNTCGIEALFCMGAMKVGITTGDTPPNGQGALYDPGHVFADPVLFDDLILDMTAKRWDQQSYMGDEFTVPLDWAKSNKQFDKKARDKLKARDAEDHDSDTDSHTLTRGESGVMDEFEDNVELRQIFLPRQQLVITIAKGENKVPLSIVAWNGPEHGPYHCLSFGKVPGNLIPLAPVPLWVDLHDITNRLFNKAANQAERQKSFGALSKKGAADGTLLTEVEDGGIYSFENPREINEVSTGGANQQTLAMVMWSKQMLEYMGGNWPALGGLGAQSGTVGQDQMLFENASGRLKDMQQSMLAFQASVIKDLAFWLWEDPVSEYHVIKQIQGTPYGIPAVWSPETRMGSFFDYTFDVDPYSKPNLSPTEKAAQFMGLVRDFILPMLPIMQQQGEQLDTEYILRELGRLNHMPNLARAVIRTQGDRHPGRPEPPGMPAHTKRTYERVNRPAATRQGNEAAMISSLLGSEKQPAEMAGLGMVPS